MCAACATAFPLPGVLLHARYVLFTSSRAVRPSCCLPWSSSVGWDHHTAGRAAHNVNRCKWFDPATTPERAHQSQNGKKVPGT
jgi:hypothetical protein